MGIDGNICADAKAESGKRVPFPNQKKVAVDLLIPIVRCLQNDAAANMFHRKPSRSVISSVVEVSGAIPQYAYRQQVYTYLCP